MSGVDNGVGRAEAEKNGHSAGPLRRLAEWLHRRVVPSDVDERAGALVRERGASEERMERLASIQRRARLIAQSITTNGGSRRK